MKTLSLLILFLSALQLCASISLPRIFSDGMVLQREQPIRVWGQASAGSEVEVAFRGKTYEASASDAGQWELLLDATPAGGPHTMQISGEGEATLTIADIMVGEVWFASGQSNMQWKLSLSEPVAAATETYAEDSLIREFQIPTTASIAPAEDSKGQWISATSKKKSDFSAVAYHFARAIVAEQGVAVGIINSSWGGSSIQAWLPESSFDQFPELQSIIDAYRASGKNHEIAARQAAYAEAKQLQDPGNRGYVVGYASGDFDASDWKTMDVPNTIESQGLMIDGAIWFRKEVSIPETMQGDLHLSLGAVDDFDITYFNGMEVGRTGREGERWWEIPRQYVIPEDLVNRGGSNTIAIRVFDHTGDGGLTGRADELHIRSVKAEQESDDSFIPVAGEWRYHIETGAIDLERSPATRSLVGEQNKTPSLLYNGMVAPVEGYSMRGFLWYQGEANSRNPESYAAYFPTMIEAWRAYWEQGALPFLFVQLPNFRAPQTSPVEGGWAGIREAQAAALELPNTAMAVTLDVGEADDIHPRQKEPVGQRLAGLAREIAYGEAVEARSPHVAEVAYEGDAARLHLSHTYGTIRTTDGAAPRSFAVRDTDGQWHWAEAKIVDSDEILLSSADVATVTGVAYAWASNPDVNTVNAAGLPLAPFKEVVAPLPETD